MASNFLFFFVCSIFIPLISHSINVPINDGFGLRLIHRDSPHSPFYNHSMSPYGRRFAAAHRSLSRLNHLHFRATLQQDPSEFAPAMIPDTSEYFINVSVGTPPTKVTAFIDTGSDLVWVKGIPFFDPDKSFSYTNLTCDAGLCYALRYSRTCEGQEPCTYQITYYDKSTTSGILSKDKFTFEAPERSPVDVGFVQFGYSDVTSPEFTGKQNGCVGLTRSGLSLISQLGIKKFSHCMTIPDDLGTGSLMYFGSKAEVYGSQTPILQTSERLYIVRFNGISIGDQIFPDGRVIVIDSGTTYSMLEPMVLEPLVDKMRQLVPEPLPTPPEFIFQLCFSGSFDEVKKLPNVTFHLGGGADVELTKETTFLEIDHNIWCLAFMRSKLEGVSVLGNFHMRNFWVGYDLERKIVSFQPAICSAF